MPIRAPSRSIFRPKMQIDQSVLEENKKIIQEIDRRKILRGAISLGALSFLTGCDVTDRMDVQKALRAVSAFNDGVQALLFRPNHLAPTFSEAEVVKPPRFNAYYECRGCETSGWRELETRACRPYRGQATLDSTTTLCTSRAGNDHPAYLCGGMGLHRPVVRSEPATFPRTHWRGPQGQVHRVQVC